MKNTQGFTLIETIIYIAIIGGVITSFTTFSLSIASLKNKNFVIQETQVNTRIASEIINKYCKNAKRVISPAKESSSSILSLEMNNGDNVIIETIDGSLELKEGLSPSQNIVSHLLDIQDLNFENNSNASQSDSISYSFTAAYRYNDTLDFDYSYPTRTTINLRN